MKRALLAISLLGCTHTTTTPMTTSHHWNLYDGDYLVLDVSSTPGAIRSVASLPPGTPPATSAFMSATSHDAGHEDAFRAWLDDAHTVDEFLAKARAAGLRIVEQ